jgi:Fe-S oxidoreductase
MIPKKIVFVSANQFVVPYPVYPIGVSCIATHLRKQYPEFDIRIFDFILNNLDDYQKLLSEFQPDYIGISFRNIDNVNFLEKEYFISGYQKIINITRKLSNAVVIAGGAGFSIFPKHLFDYLRPDFGIYGEGEDSIGKLIHCLENKLEFSHIEGLVYSDKNGTHINKHQHYFHDLDLDFEPELIDYYWKNSGMLNIQTKRGCPYHCIYCTYPLIEGSTVRTLDPDKIVEILKTLYYEKDINYVFFTDSVFNMCNDYNIELSKKIIESRINIHWGAYFSPHNLEPEHLKLFKEAGLTHIEFGTESLSDTQLQNYGKHFTVNDILEKSELCNKYNIFFCHSMILGGYGETEETLNETFENSRKINNTVFFPFVGIRIYPNTKLYQLSLDEGIIAPDDILMEPKYYVSKNINLETIKEKAMATGKSWQFPDSDISGIMDKMRKRNKKGPLWQHLRK